LSKSHDFRFFFPLQSDNLGPNFSRKNPSLKSHKLFVKWQNLAKTNIVVALSYNHLWFIVQFASGSLQSYILKNSVLTKREICVRMCSCVCVYHHHCCIHPEFLSSNQFFKTPTISDNNSGTYEYRKTNL
jgi:hypothetical protein